jgi:hypothetical protein
MFFDVLSWIVERAIMKIGVCGLLLSVVWLAGCGIKTTLSLRPEELRGNWIGYGPDYAFFRISLTNASGGVAISVVPPNHPVKVKQYGVAIRKVHSRQRQFDFDLCTSEETFSVVGKVDYPYLKCEGIASYGGKYNFLLMRETEVMNCARLLQSISNGSLQWTNKAWQEVDTIPKGQLGVDYHKRQMK